MSFGVKPPGGQPPSVGTQVNDALVKYANMGDKEAAMIGAQIDLKRGDLKGVLSNLKDAMEFTPKEFREAIGRQFAQPGFCEPPQKSFGKAFEKILDTFFPKEKLFEGNFANKLLGPAFERALADNPELKRAFEAKLGGQIVLDDKFDGKVRVLRPQPHPLASIANEIQKHIGSFANHFQPNKGAEVLKQLEGFLNGIGGFPPKLQNLLGGALKDLLGGIGKPGFGGLPGIGGGGVPGIGGGGVPGSPGGPGGPGGTGGPSPGDILKDPNLSFEQKVFLFMLAFCEKKQKEVEGLMAEADKQQSAKGGEKGGDGGGGIGGMLGGLGSLAGGALSGGNPLGAAAGGAIGNAVGGLFGGGGGGGGAAGGAEGGKGAEQLTLAKVQNAMQEMQKFVEMLVNTGKTMQEMGKKAGDVKLQG